MYFFVVLFGYVGTTIYITCTVAANIFFKCKFENFLMVVSTMCPYIKVAELNTLSVQMEKELQAYISQFVNEMEKK